MSRTKIAGCLGGTAVVATTLASPLGTGGNHANVARNVRFASYRNTYSVSKGPGLSVGSAQFGECAIRTYLPLRLDKCH